MNNQTISKVFSILFFTLFLLNFGFGQNNNLKVAYRDGATSPRNIDICGDPSIVVVRISIDGISPSNRTNIEATLNLFKGIEVSSYVLEATSPGVSIDSSNKFKPKFFIDELNISTKTFVTIGMRVTANCDYVDTLKKNDQIDVFDTWNFKYSLGTQNNLTEKDVNTSYRDAMKVPFFTTSVTNNVNGTAQVGVPFQRTVILNNSGLNGVLKDFRYRNYQGAGAVVTKITINGVQIPFTKNYAFNAAGDTLYEANVTENYFIGNTKGQTAPGNGDNRFDPNETVTIIEDVYLVKCDKSNISTHESSWGCGNKDCSVVSAKDFIRIGQGNANITFTKGGGSVPNETAGYCKKGVSSIKFSNTGFEIDKNVGGMFDLATGIGLGNNVVLQDNGFKITSMKINDVKIYPLASNVDISKLDTFKLDLDGVDGLADLDKDGRFDDLPIGKSVVITIEYETDCANLRNDSIFSSKCFNNIQAAFSALISYTDYCGRRISYTENNYYAPLNTNDTYENCTDPDAYTNGKPFAIEHFERRNVFNFEKNCSNQEYLEVAVKIPNGFDVVIDSNYLKLYTDKLTLLGSRLSNDTMYFKYDATFSTFLNADYYLKLGFKANCKAAVGPSNFPVSISFICPPCGCNHLLYCDTLRGPVIHYSQTLCPVDPQYDCAKGIATTSFDVNRTTIGYTDNNYNNKFPNPNLKAAISCDSVQINVKNVVGNTPITDSLGVAFYYEVIDKKNPQVEIFTKGKIKLTVHHAGSKYTCVVDSNKVTTQLIDTIRWVRINLDSCVKNLGFALVKGDSVNLEANFLVNPNGAFTSQFKKLPTFRGHGYYTSDGKDLICDDFGDVFKLAKTNTIFSFPDNSTYPKGCQTTDMDWKLVTVNNGYRDVFGEEYRKAIKVDSIKFNFDTLILKAFKTEVFVSFAGHPIFGNSFYPLKNLDNTGVYIAKFDTLKSVPSLTNIQSYAFALRIKATPNCKSLFGSKLGNNVFDFDPSLSYINRFYAAEIGDGSCIEKKVEVKNTDIIYNYPPEVDLTFNSNPNLNLTGDTAVWEVKYCNASFKGDAGLTWYALNLPSKNINILSIENITNPANIKKLAITKYGGVDSLKLFVLDDGLKIARANAVLDDVCNIFRIKALVKTCGIQKIGLTAGWECTKPTQVDWNPDLYPPCQPIVKELQVRTLAPFIDANFINQNFRKPNICDSTTMTILLRNTDLGRVFNIKSKIILPLTGMKIIPGTIQVAYPSSASFVSITDTPKFVGFSTKGKIYEFENFKPLSNYLDINGLNGFNPSSPNDSNEFKITFKISNDCDYLSGSHLNFDFQGEDQCGSKSNIELGESVPLFINGADRDTNKLFAVSLGTNSKLVPNGISTITLNTKNLTQTTTDGKEKVSIKLPKDITYVLGSSTSLQPNGWVPGDPQIKLAGDFQILNWYLPKGLKNDSTAIFSFSVSSPNYNCNDGGKDIALSALIEKLLVCTVNQTSCNINIIASDNGELLTSVNVGSGNITITADKPIVNKRIKVNKNTTIKLKGNGANQYQWKSLNTGIIVGMDSILNVIADTNITYVVNGGSNAICLIPDTIFIEIQSTSNPPKFCNPMDVFIDCPNGILPAPVNPCVTDPDGTVISLTYKDSTIKSSGCEIIINRNWTATDNDGNQSTYLQKVIITDKIAPVLKTTHPLLVGLKSGDSLTMNCNQSLIFGPNDFTATDNCSKPQITFVDFAKVLADCKTVGYMTLLECEWVAKDSCGNSSTFKIFIKVIDNIPPILISIPPDITINQGDNTNNGSMKVFDVCDNNPKVTFRDLLSTNDIDSFISRQWIAMDNCGNTFSKYQKITIKLQQTNNCSNDSIPPVLTLNNATLKNRNTGDIIIVNCNDKLDFVQNDVSAVDSCSTVTPNFTKNIIQGDNCTVDKTVSTTTYKWSFVDTKLNKSTFEITVVRKDTSAPSITKIPADMTINPGQSIFNGMMTATDACSALSISNKDSISLVGKDTLITRTWNAKDACGNEVKAIQKVFIQPIKTCQNDSIKPILTLKDTSLFYVKDGDIFNVMCSNANKFKKEDIIISDNCDTTPQLTFVQAIFKNGNFKTDGYVRIMSNTWTGTDINNNTTTYVLYTRVIDTVAPVFTNKPIDVTISKTDPNPVFTPIVNDACTNIDTIIFNEMSDTSNCVATITRTWTAYDLCGNNSKIKQIITINDLCTPFKCTIFNTKDTILNSKYCLDSLSICLKMDSSLLDRSKFTINKSTDTLQRFVCIDPKNNTGLGFKVLPGVYKIYAFDPFKDCRDTLNLTVNCSKQADTIIYNTIIEKDSSKICFDTLMNGRIISITNQCLDKSGTNVSYNIVGNCLEFKGLSIGDDTACLLICTAGYCKRFQIITTTLPIKKISLDTSFIKLVPGQKDTICFELNGITATNVVNNCPNANSNISYQIIKNCIYITSNNPGNDTLCIRYCIGADCFDKWFIFSAVRKAIGPIAVNDTLITRINTSKTLIVLKNDTLNGKWTSYRIIQQPRHGTINFLDSISGEVIYNPELDYCDGKFNDAFVYEVCTQGGCSLATVNIKVICDNITIYNGFSPNKDGVNDKFLIRGIEEYPKNSLSIYNRWGELVMKAEPYNNDWEGEWNGKELPDGTYFYCLTDGNGNNFTGYLQLLR